MVIPAFLCFSHRLMQYHQIVVTGSGGLPDELLYGRVGFLYSLVYVNQQLGQDRIPLQYIQQVVCVDFSESCND